MKSVFRTALFASICFAAFANVANAQPGARTRVVVTLKSSTDFSSFERDFAGDARTERPSAAYHRRGVLGAVMSLERRHAFRADAFFSRAVQGFAA